MKKIVGFLLVVSVSLYTTPLKADSYDTIQTEEPTQEPTSCEVTPETSTVLTPSEEQDSYAEQEEAAPAEEQDSYADTGNYEDQETLVQPASSEVTKKARTKYWQNILLAVAVVAVAITALLLVHSHEGHRSKD